MPEPKKTVILIAAEDSDFRVRIAQMLGKREFELLEAADVSAALRCIKHHQPLLVITPVREAEDFGVRLCRRVKSDALLSAAPVLQISPENLLNADGTAKDLGIEPRAVFYEPFNSANFLSLVNSLIRSQTCEQTLRLRDERYNALMTATSQVVWFANGAGTSKELNDWWKNLTGQNAEESSGWGWLEFVHTDDRDRVQLAWQHSLDTKKPYIVEYRVKAIDGGYHNVSVRCFPVFNPDESFREWVGTITNITAQKQAEAVFSQQNALLELSHEPVFVWSYESGILSWNRGCEELYGYTKEEALGKTSYNFLQTEFPVSRAVTEESLKKTGQWAGELRHKTRNGRTVFVESRWMLTTDNDGRQLVLESNRDITDRRQAEERYRAFIEQSSEGIWRIEVDPPIPIDLPFDEQIKLAYERGYIAECNDAMARMYGMESASDLIGVPFGKLFVQTDPANYLYLRNFMESGYRLSEAESHEQDAEGRDLYFLNNLVGIIADQKLIRVWGTQRNITQRREAENRLRQSEQKFITLAAAMPQLVWTAAPDGAFDYLNEQWSDYFAGDIERFYGAGWQAAVHVDDLPDMLDDWRRCLATGAPLEVYLRLRHRSGEHRWQIVRGVPLTNEAGQILKWVGTCTDIHDQREVERALRESEERMKLAMRIADIGTWDYNALTNTLIWSDSHFTMFGYLPSHNSRATPEMWRERVHPDDLERVLTEIKRAEQERDLLEIEYRIIRFSDEKTRWISAAGQHFYDEAGNMVRFVGVFYDVTERKEAESRIRKANERFQIAEEAANGFLYDWDIAANRVERSATFSKVLGYEGEELKLSAQNWQDFIHPDDYEQATRLFYKALENDKRFATEYRVRHKRGHWVHVIDRGMIFRDEEGKPTRVIGSTVDINERKQIENALRDSEERQRLLTENLNNIFWILDWKNNRPEYFSPAFERIIGYERNYVLKNRDNWFSIIHPNDVENSLKAFQEIETKGRYENEYRIVRPDGTVRWLHDQGQPIYNENGEIQRVIGVAEDVTERREILDALRQSQMQLKLSTDAAQMSPWHWSLESGKVTLSPLHIKLWGIEESKLAQAGFEDWAERVHPEDREKAFAKIEEARKTYAHYESEYRLIPSNSEAVRWIRSLGTFSYNQDGEAVEMYGVDYDITERKKAEQEREKLIESERRAREEAEFANRAKDEFLAVLSHELRTPLNAMYGWARMLSSGTLDEAMQKRAVEVIERNIQLQSKLIEDILDVSRIVSGKIKLEPRRLDLTALIKSTVEMSRPSAVQKEINLEINFSDESVRIEGDSERLQQVLSNLISNAVKFTPTGGIISVALEKQNGFAQISVTDSGIGIAPDFLPHVFDRFRQADSSSKRKHGGLGLGLAIVKHLVELHNGCIAAESEGEGKGARFIVALPLDKAELIAEQKLETLQNTTETNGNGHHSRFQNLRVLVVEDDPDAIEVLRVILETHGAQVRSFGTAKHALEALQKEEFDLILSDIGLPEMDGLEFIGRVRDAKNENLKYLPALAVTAYASPEDRERVISAGFNDCLAKPISFDVLERATIEAMREAQWLRGRGNG
jgi:PAS domain S-box-containing protein